MNQCGAGASPAAFDLDFDLEPAIFHADVGGHSCPPLDPALDLALLF
jgi:hypothetical protein